MGTDKGHARAGVQPREGEELQAEARLPQAALHGHVSAGVMCGRINTRLRVTKTMSQDQNVIMHRSQCHYANPLFMLTVKTSNIVKYCYSRSNFHAFYCTNYCNLQNEQLRRERLGGRLENVQFCTKGSMS